MSNSDVEWKAPVIRIHKNDIYLTYKGGSETNRYCCVSLIIVDTAKGIVRSKIQGEGRRESPGGLEMVQGQLKYA